MRAKHDGNRAGRLALALVIGAVACGENASLIGPDNQLEVTSATDQFQFQLTALNDVTDSRSYDWENTGDQATIDISQAIASGSAVLTIRDADGTVMYDADIGADNDTTTPQGVPGTWQVDVVLTNVTGTFNFRVQKTT